MRKGGRSAMKEKQANLFWSWVAILAFLFSLAVLTPRDDEPPAAAPRASAGPPTRTAAAAPRPIPLPQGQRPASAYAIVRLTPSARRPLVRNAVEREVQRPAVQLLPSAHTAPTQAIPTAAKIPAQGKPLAVEQFAPAVEPQLSRTAYWQTPHELLARLDALAVDPRATAWALWVRGRVEALMAAGPGGDEAAAFQALSAAADRVEPQAALLGDDPLASEWRRAEHALRRRLEVWPADVAARRAELVRGPAEVDPRPLASCLANLDGALANADSAAGWREYLLLGELGEAAAERSSDDSRREVARRVMERLDTDRLTPAQRAFLVNGPAAELGAALRGMAAETLESADLLAEVERYEQLRHPSQGRHVAVSVRRLAESSWPEEQRLGRQLDAYYRNCNLRVAIAGELLTRLLPPQPDAEEPVRTTILGNPVSGWGTTRTSVAVRLLPDPRRLRLQLETRGEIDSTTVARSGPVAIHSDNRGAFSAVKPLVIDLRGVTAEPTMIAADNNSRLTGIHSRYDRLPLVGALVREYARGEHDRSREAARRESEGQIRSAAGGRIDSAVQSQLGEVNEALDSRLLDVLRGLSLEPQWMLAETTEQRLTARLRLASDAQLGAHTPRPRAPSDSLASLQVHETALNNLLEGLQLAGRTFTALELCQLIGERLNLSNVSPPEGIRDDLKFTFAAEDAVQVKCEAGRIEIALRLAELTLEGKRWRNLLVRAYYRAEAAGPNVEIVRDGSIQLAGERLSPRSQIVLRGLFSRVFDRDARFGPGDLFDRPELTGLGVTQFVVQDGWIGVAIGPRRMGDEAVVAGR
jgi:hypothetical protein